MNFQDFWNKFSFNFGQLCDKKTCAFVVMGIGKKVVWAGGGMGRGHQADNGIMGLCLPSGLGRHNQTSNVALVAIY